MIRKNKNLVKLFLFLSAAVLIVLIIFTVLSVRKKDGRFDVPIFSGQLPIVPDNSILQAFPVQMGKR